MPDKFDPYREALVVETVTIWSPEAAQAVADRKESVAQKLHADASGCANLEYIRVPTGFCRRITVTPEDVARVS